MIFIPGNTPSSKNSKQITKSGFIVHSKQCQLYYRETKQLWLDNKDKFIEMFKDKPKPYYVGFYFVRKSKHRFDYNNVNQTLTDLMTKYGWLEDDDSSNIKSIFLGYHHDKDAPGAYVVDCSHMAPLYDKQCSIILQDKSTSRNVESM